MFEPKVNRNRSVTHKHTTLFEYSSNYIDDVVEFTDKLREFYDTHDSVEVTISQDEDSMSVDVWWMAPETDEEMNARIKYEERRFNEWQRHKEAEKKIENDIMIAQKAEDSAELERLMRKFSKKEIMEMMELSRIFREDGVEDETN